MLLAGRWAVWWRWGLEDGLCSPVGVDVDSRDESGEQVLDEVGWAVVDGVPEGDGHVFELVARWWTRGAVERGGELVAVLGEFVTLGGEILDAGGAHLLGHGGGLERAQVAVERGGRVADLRGGGGEFGFEARAVVVVVCAGRGECLLEVIEVAVGVDERVDDGRLGGDERVEAGGL
ncbi:MAG: hypothetical protein KY460_05575 [Actinobacteria bacterium]|nr:hypothetical protein [Actinomycetota bacterium]